MPKASATTKKLSDLEAVGIVRDALKGFDTNDRERILRWVRETLGLTTEAPPSATPRLTHPTPPGPPSVPPAAPPAPATTHHHARDIQSFVNQKNPQTDIQLATTIAYYYRFEAPEKDRREEIDAALLREACRLAGRPGKLVHPLMTLHNAHGKGLLDKGSTRGTFTINSVGENLVGMTLPGDASQPARSRGTKAARKKPARKTR
jgi:hypothetical protein